MIKRIALLILLICTNSFPTRSLAQIPCDEATDWSKKLQSGEYQTEENISILIKKLTECLESKNPKHNTVDYIKLNFYLGCYNLSLDRGREAESYFNKCIECSKSFTLEYSNGISYFQKIEEIVGNYNSSPLEKSNLSLEYTGKEKFYNLSLNYPEVSYSDDQIKILRSRIYSTSDTASFKRMLDSINSFEIIYFHSPFMVCLSNLSSYELPDILDLIDRKTSYFSSLFSAKNIASKKIVPIYIVNTTSDDPGFSEYNELYEKIHLIPAGNKFGFFNRHDNSVTCWYPSGNGTLAHELIHNLINSDFPNAPFWLNEGLASLNEEMEIDNNKPIDNWRLIFIQEHKEINNGYISLKTLLSNDTLIKINQRVKLSYFRYFCFYLYEKDILPQLYKSFRNDKSGYDNILFLRKNIPWESQKAIILKLLGFNSLQELQTDFESWLFERGYGYENRFNDSGYISIVRDDLQK